MRRAYADRNTYLGDPGVREERRSPACWIPPTWPGCARRSIPSARRRATRSAPASPPAANSLETTHYSVVDGEGNAVAVTYTLNGGYGNGITVPGLGFLLNNEMDDFASKPG